MKQNRISGIMLSMMMLLRCSRYALKQGDKIEWLYTCDLGNDISGGAWQKDE